MEKDLSKKTQAKKHKKKEKVGPTRKEERKIEKAERWEEHDAEVYMLVKEEAYDWIINDYRCMECREPIGDNGQMAHAIPRSRGGETSVDNVKYKCVRCHFNNDHHLNIK